MLFLLAIAAGLIPLVLIISAVRGPRGGRRTQRDLQRPDLNFPEDDSREDMARYGSPR